MSAESEAAGAIRVMPPCMGMGQAAGIAAALALEEDKDVREIDVNKVRSEIVKQGGLLNV